MTLPFAFSTAVAAIALFFGALTLGVSRAPGFRELRPFAGLTLAAAVFAAADALATMQAPRDVYLVASRVTLSAIAIHGLFWVLYAARLAGRALDPLEKALVVAGVGCALLALVPGAVVSDQLRSHEVAWLGVTYVDALPTKLGELVFAFYGISAWVPLLRLGRRAFDGHRDARPGVIALLAVDLAGVADSFSTTGITQWPYLLDLGLLVAVTVVGGSIVLRVVEHARALGALEEQLRVQLEERLGSLRAAEERLARMESTAGVARLTGGVAHDVNNASAIVSSNLAFVEEALREPAPSAPELEEALVEAEAGARRVRAVVGRLASVGAFAGGRAPRLESVRLLPLVRDAVASLRPPRSIGVTFALPAELEAQADPPLLAEMVLQLTENAIAALEAGRGGGTIVWSAELAGERVALRLRDDGPGIPAERLSRLFEPYSNLSSIGEKGALGLPASAGLARAMGGALRVEATGPEGTRVLVELPAVAGRGA